MAAKPLIPTMIRTEFGDVLESEAFHASQGPQGDFTYVPGYSDMRRERDQHTKEVVDGKRAPKDVRALPVRLQWVRHAKYSGQPDNRKLVEFGNLHYRSVTKDDMGTEWFKSMPEGAVLGADGTIHQGDCTLMMTDAKSAARAAAAIQYRTNQMTRSDSAAGKLMELGATHPGSDPTIDVKAGEEIRVGSSIKSK